MRKIAFLLLGMFLLLPIAIYIGNLADIPKSKKIVVYLRNLVGMTETIEKIPASYSLIGEVETWRDLGTGNFTDLLKLLATPNCYTTWQANAGDFLTDSLESSAFFSSAWSFWQTQHEKIRLVGYYQPWTNTLLYMHIRESKGHYQATSMGVIQLNELTSSTTPKTVAQELTAHLDQAEQVFRAIAENTDDSTNTLNSTTIKKAHDLLTQYVTEQRNNLAISSDKKQTDTRLAILEWLDTVQTGQAKEIRTLEDQPSDDWLKQLQAVLLQPVDTENWLLAAINHRQPEHILLAQLHIKNRKVQVIEVQIWDAETAGNLP